MRVAVTEVFPSVSIVLVPGLGASPEVRTLSSVSVRLVSLSPCVGYG
jgi:hypothetical protein